MAARWALVGRADEPSVLRRDLGDRATAHLRVLAAGRPLVVGIDDAHLLDEPSAALGHHLVTTGTAFVVATVRQGEAVRDAVRSLWTDDLAERDGVWSWDGDLGGGRLGELIEERPSGVSGVARAAPEVLAVGEPLPRDVVRAAVEEPVLRELDGRGLLAVGRTVRLVHPLYGERSAQQVGRRRHMSRAVLIRVRAVPKLAR